MSTKRCLKLAMCALVAYVLVPRAWAGEPITSANVNQLNNFVDAAGISLADAIKKAEKECNGKAVEAVANHDDNDGRPAHYKITCLAKNNELSEVCISSGSGELLGIVPIGRERTFRQTAFEDKPKTVTTTTTTTVISSDSKPFRVQKASDLIGKKVENLSGEKLGEIQDLALDPDRGRVAYAVVGFGGFMGLGEKWFAIPPRALTLPSDAHAFVLPVEKERMKNATGFDKNHWPTMGDQNWATGIHEFYGQTPYWKDVDLDNATPSATFRIHRASELIGKNVKNDKGEKLGEVKDLVVDPDSWRVAYAVLSFGGFLGMGDKLFPIPPAIVQTPDKADHVILKIDKELLKNAPGFDKNHWPDMADQTYGTTTYEFYHQKPYWARETKRDRANP